MSLSHASAMALTSKGYDHSLQSFVRLTPLPEVARSSRQPAAAPNLDSVPSEIVVMREGKL